MQFSSATYLPTSLRSAARALEKTLAFACLPSLPATDEQTQTRASEADLETPSLFGFYFTILYSTLHQDQSFQFNSIRSIISLSLCRRTWLRKLLAIGREQNSTG